MQYNVKEPLKHDGKDYAIGGTIDLTAEQAAPLLAIGTLEEAPAAQASTAPPEDDATRLAAIKDAILALDTADKSMWLNDGRPDTKAIAAVTGWPVSAADRNAAWAELKPQA